MWRARTPECVLVPHKSSLIRTRRMKTIQQDGLVNWFCLPLEWCDASYSWISVQQSRGWDVSDFLSIITPMRSWWNDDIRRDVWDPERSHDEPSDHWWTRERFSFQLKRGRMEREGETGARGVKRQLFFLLKGTRGDKTKRAVTQRNNPSTVPFHGLPPSRFHRILLGCSGCSHGQFADIIRDMLSVRHHCCCVIGDGPAILPPSQCSLIMKVWLKSYLFFLLIQTQLRGGKTIKTKGKRFKSEESESSWTIMYHDLSNSRS